MIVYKRVLEYNPGHDGSTCVAVSVDVGQLEAPSGGTLQGASQKLLFKIWRSRIAFTAETRF